MRSARSSGFSLVELVIVIVVIGVLGASVAMFIENPVRAYFDSIRRAQMTDSADRVARRWARELQDSLPNAVRIANNGGTVFVEFVPVRDAGRYRWLPSSGAEPSGTDPLDFTDGNDATFQVLGRPVEIPSDTSLVVANLGSGALDAYAGANRRVLTSIGTVSSVSFTATGVALPSESPEHRFYVVATPVTWACTPGAGGTGRIERVTDYGWHATQPASLVGVPLTSGQRALMAEGVADCNIELGATLSTLDQVSVRLQFAAAGESVTLLTQVQLGNRP